MYSFVKNITNSLPTFYVSGIYYQIAVCRIFTQSGSGFSPTDLSSSEVG